LSKDSLSKKAAPVGGLSSLDVTLIDLDASLNQSTASKRFQKPTVEVASRVSVPPVDHGLGGTSTSSGAALIVTVLCLPVLRRRKFRGIVVDLTPVIMIAGLSCVNCSRSSG
jgi:hypothetical protein